MIKKLKTKTKPKLDWIQSFPTGKIDLVNYKPVKDLKTIMFSFDTEYQSGIHGARVNTIICYSYTVFDFSTGKYAEDIIYLDYSKQERKKLQDIIIEAVSSIGINGISLSGYDVIVVAHFFVAEFFALDYSQRDVLLPNLDIISKTMISNRFYQYYFNNKSRNRINIRIRFCDTILLLPITHKSLKKASEFVTNQKIELSQNQISNMIALLNSDKELFKEYAILDSKITFDLFIKLNVYLNRLNGTTSEIFTTLSSASVKKYKRYITKLFKELNIDIEMVYPGRKSFSDNILNKYKPLAVRGFIGGLNNAYKIGKC